MSLPEDVFTASSQTHARGDRNVLPESGQGQIPLTYDKAEETDNWEHSPNNPRNWSPLRKWTAAALVSIYSFVPDLATSMMAPGLPCIAVKYDITNATVLALTISIFRLSFAIGPLFLAPLSEMYGRVWVLHISNIVSLCFNLGCAIAPTASALIAFRFLGGFAGGVPIAVGAGCISDLFSDKDLAFAIALYSCGPLIGPAIGPIMGGFITQAIGIQYVFYVIVAFCGVSSVLAIPLLRETYAPVIRRRLHLHGTELEKGAVVFQDQDPLGYLWINLKRPVILLTRSFVCFILSLYMAMMYGTYFLMFTIFPMLFANVYQFSVGTSGLAYIGVGIGFLVAAICGAKISDQIYLRLAAKNGGIGKPEMRIPALTIGSLTVPIGLLWYGWSAQAKAHWIMPIIGTAIYSFSLMTTYLPIQLYLVDTFTYSASATAAAAVFRSFLGFIFPLFGERMFASLGYGGGNSLLAGAAIVIAVPFPIWIYYYGERIRARSPLSN